MPAKPDREAIRSADRRPTDRRPERRDSGSWCAILRLIDFTASSLSGVQQKFTISE